MSDDLEEQYEQGMEHRRIGGRRGHLGLGFHDEGGDGEKEATEEEKKEETEKEEEKEKKENEETGEKEEKNEDTGKRKHSEEAKEDKGTDKDNDEESPVKKMKLNFVKESS